MSPKLAGSKKTFADTLQSRIAIGHAIIGQLIALGYLKPIGPQEKAFKQWDSYNSAWLKHAFIIQSNEYAKRYVNSDTLAFLAIKYEGDANSLYSFNLLKTRLSLKLEFLEDLLNKIDFLASAEKPVAPSLANLHPKVQDAASKLFDDAHYPQAIHAACTGLEKAIQSKAGQSASVTGTALIGKAFPKDNPLILLSGDQGEREGYGFLYRGLLQAIRNHYAHNVTATDPARAIEWLGFISALFYKLEEGTITPPAS